MPLRGPVSEGSHQPPFEPGLRDIYSQLATLTERLDGLRSDLSDSFENMATLSKQRWDAHIGRNGVHEVMEQRREDGEHRLLTILTIIGTILSTAIAIIASGIR